MHIGFCDVLYKVWKYINFSPPALKVVGITQSWELTIIGVFGALMVYLVEMVNQWFKQEVEASKIRYNWTGSENGKMSQWTGLLRMRGCEKQLKIVWAGPMMKSSWWNERWKCYRCLKPSAKQSGDWVIGQERARLLY